MEKFALGISIGAALSNTFLSTVTTGEKKIQALTGRADQLGKQKIAVDNVKKYRKELSDLAKAVKACPWALPDLKARIKETGQALKNAGLEARGFGINVKRLAAEEKRLDTALKATNKSLKHRTALKANKETRREIRGGFLEAAAPVAAIAAPVMGAIKFESVMADVNKVVTPEAFKGMDKDILALSTRIPMAADGIASIVASAGQAGIAKSREELIGFARTAATMGVAFDMGGAESGKMMADWRSGMKLSQLQAVNLADAVNHLSNNMNAQARDLGEVLQRQGAVAMSAGLTETQVASLGAALLSGGAGPEIAATALKNLTGALTKGKAATKAQRDAFADLGLDAVEMAARMQDNAPEAINSVFQALKNAPKEEQSALISQLFGEESKGAIAPLLANMENLGMAFDLTSDKLKYAGSMQKEYEVRSKTTANSLALLRNKGARLGVSLGAVLLPAINNLVGPIGGVLDGVVTMAEAFPGLTTVAVGAAAGFAIGVPALLAVRYSMSMASDAVVFSRLVWGGLSRVLSLTRIRVIAMAAVQKAGAAATGIMTAAQWAWNAALNANPIGLVVAGVGALAGAAYIVYKKWEPIKTFFTGLWDTVKGVFGKIAGFARFIPGFSKSKELDTAPASTASTNKPVVFQAAQRDSSSADALKLDALKKNIRQGSQQVHISVSPTINIAPGADAAGVRQAVSQSMGDSTRQMKKALEEVMSQDRRLSYA